MKIYRLERRHETNPMLHNHNPGTWYMDPSRPTPHECGSFGAAGSAYAAACAAGDYTRPSRADYVCGVEMLDDLGLWFDMQALPQSGKSADFQVTTWETDDYFLCQRPFHDDEYDDYKDCAGQAIFHRAAATLLDTMRIGEYVMMHTEAHGKWTGYIKKYLY